MNESLEDLRLKYEKALKDKLMLHALLEKTSKELRRALEAERRFLAMFSHEIRTPLNSIIGFMELLRESPLSEKQRKYLDNAYRSAKHLLSLINNILDISKIEAGQLELSCEEFDLGELLIDSVVIISPRVKSNVDLLINVPEIDFFVKGDPVRIKQIFLNLLGNAAKFTEKGYIKLSVEKMSDLQDGKILFLISVEDTGIGIPKERQDDLFKPFKQLHDSYYAGTGLGLYLSRSLARLMDGDIYVESEEGKGSKFFVRLVLEKGKKKELSFSFGGRKIAVALEESSYKRSLLKKLENAGANPISCSPILSKISRCLFSREWDVVILDADLLGEEGMYLAKLVKKCYPEIVIVGFTGDPKRYETASEYDAVLFKESSFYKVISVISSAIERTSVKFMRSGFSSLDVLVVEDTDLNMELAKEMFKSYFGIVVDVAYDGKEAVEKAMNKKYDVIFMDIQMPVMDGLTATQKIREFDDSVPIIAMTANAFSDDVERALSAGMNGYIRKPIDVSEIKDVLVKVLAEKGKVLEADKVEQIVNFMRAHFAELFGDGAAERLLKRAINNIVSVIDRIEKAMQKEDYESLERALHSLKGILINSGLVELANLAKEVEQKAKKREPFIDMEGLISSLVSALRGISRFS